MVRDLRSSAAGVCAEPVVTPAAAAVLPSTVSGGAGRAGCVAGFFVRFDGGVSCVERRRERAALAEHGELLRHEAGELREQIELPRNDALRRVRVRPHLRFNCGQFRRGRGMAEALRRRHGHGAAGDSVELLRGGRREARPSPSEFLDVLGQRVERGDLLKQLADGDSQQEGVFDDADRFGEDDGVRAHFEKRRVRV